MLRLIGLAELNFRLKQEIHNLMGYWMPPRLPDVAS
jgi:hypothetical protein